MADRRSRPPPPPDRSRGFWRGIVASVRRSRARPRSGERERPQPSRLSAAAPDARARRTQLAGPRPGASGAGSSHPCDAAAPDPGRARPAFRDRPAQARPSACGTPSTSGASRRAPARAGDPRTGRRGRSEPRDLVPRHRRAARPARAHGRRASGAPDTPEQRILAAILARGGRAIASHRSAAYLWGVDIDGANPVDISGASRGCRPALDWVSAHNPRDLDDLRPVQRHGIPTTNPLRVLVDLGQVAPSAVTAGPRALPGRGARRPSLGEGGARPPRPAGPARDLRPPRCARRRHHRRRAGRQRAGAGHGQVARRARLPPAQFHARILGFEVDFAIVPERVVLECDGWTSHGLDRVQFERDRRRDAALAAAGWIVLRFTWMQITRRPSVGRGGHPTDPRAARPGLLKPVWRGLVASVRQSRARTRWDASSRPAGRAAGGGAAPSVRGRASPRTARGSGGPWSPGRRPS